MKCIINENNEITAFYENDSNAPENAVSCDKIYPIHSFSDNKDNIKYLYKLTNGKVALTTDGFSYNASQYARNRQESYPPIADQLDMIYHAGQGGDAFQKAIKEVKDKYPKG